MKSFGTLARLLCGRIDDYLNARVTIFSLPDMAGFDVLTVFTSLASLLLGLSETHRLLSFYLDLPQDPSVIELDETILFRKTHKISRLQQVNDYITQNIGIEV